MTSPIFIDANIPIYAAGRPHPLKESCARLIHIIAEQPTAFVTDAEVLQELLHYYRSRDRWNEGRAVLDSFATLMRDRIEPIYHSDIATAARLAERQPNLQARDLLHLAVMDRLSVHSIATADRGFDRIASIARLDPHNVVGWPAEGE